MCVVDRGFKFCTCSDLSTAEFTWRLSRYLGEVENAPMGSIIGPSHDLGRGLTAPNILALLNEGKGFDFAYTPTQHDCLHISHHADRNYEYMSFLYSGGEWVEGMNSPFSSRTEELGRGTVGE